MAKINLLPWREELRRERNQNFYAASGIIGALGLGIVFMINMQVDSQLQGQMQRNQFIKTEQAALEQKITEIDKLKQERAELESRMKIIQDLQGNRSVVVRLFDEISKKTPDGVFLKKVERIGNKFKMQGVAEANNRISNMMRNLEQSPWFENANLESVVSDDAKTSNTFDLIVNEESSRKKEEDDDAS